MLLMIGWAEGLIIFGVIVLLFGATQIPKIAKAMGEGLKEFKKSVKDIKENDDNEETNKNNENKE